MELQPERRTTSEENRKKYKTFRDSIEVGRCNDVMELFSARKEGLITEEQCDSLISLLVKKLKEMSEIDPLTKSFSRASLKPELEGLATELNYKGEKERKLPIQSIMVVFLDIKEFKKLNDTHGHLVGDQALVAVANTLKKEIKRDDKIFRVGGDEFIILLPIRDANPRSLAAIFERIYTKANETLSLNKFNFDGSTTEIPIVLSMGYELLNKGDVADPDKLVNQADKKMYANKARQNGK